MKPYSWLNKEHRAHLTAFLPHMDQPQFDKETHLPQKKKLETDDQHLATD